jgi:hypothetical protein
MTTKVRPAQSLDDQPHGESQTGHEAASGMGPIVAVGRELCEHLFVTAQSSPFARFRRALDRGNDTDALSTATEREHIWLTEALELCLLLVESPDRFGRAALRWHGRYCREIRDVDLDEGLAVLATLGALRGPRSKLAAYALAELLGERRGLERAGEILVAWGRR